MGKGKISPKFVVMKRLISSKMIKNSVLGPPDRVLVDTNFVNFSIQNKLDLEKAMTDCLYAKFNNYFRLGHRTMAYLVRMTKSEQVVECTEAAFILKHVVAAHVCLLRV
ncbi:hypothetical protein C5167_050073 [Papaver somniferum]|uniref:Uncharacterized protein n=1 Tax=Papaver somniferum TaxID=3469 RepID=A0A4Y7KMM0_PAPSO|nr:hypothetical protein C5167_050073 [Papaver somniferum]